MRKQVKFLGKMQCNNPCNSYIRGRFFRMKKEYKKTVRHQKQCYKNKIADRIRNTPKRNFKEFWKALDQLSDIEKYSISRVSSDVIPANKWIEHYSKLFKNLCNIASLDENKMKDFFLCVRNHFLVSLIMLYISK